MKLVWIATIMLLSSSLPAFGQQTQDNSQQQNLQVPQTQTTNSDSIPAQVQYPPSNPDQQSLAARVTATCKITDPPPRQAELWAAPPGVTDSPMGTDQSKQGNLTTDISGKPTGDAGVAYDSVLESLAEKATGCPQSWEGTYQTIGQKVAGTTVNFAAKKLSSQLLSKAGAWLASDAAGGFLGVTFASSEAGGPLDTLSLDQWRAYKRSQFDQAQTSWFLESPGSFCVAFPTDTRCTFPAQLFPFQTSQSFSFQQQRYFGPPQILNLPKPKVGPVYTDDCPPGAQACH